MIFETIAEEIAEKKISPGKISPGKSTIYTPVTLVWYIDADADMEKLELNGDTGSGVIGFGNVWDEHCADRFDAVKGALDILGIKYVAKIDKDWKYEGP